MTKRGQIVRNAGSQSSTPLDQLVSDFVSLICLESIRRSDVHTVPAMLAWKGIRFEFLPIEVHFDVVGLLRRAPRKGAVVLSEWGSFSDQVESQISRTATSAADGEWGTRQLLIRKL
jgi:hypothetical protein